MLLAAALLSSCAPAPRVPSVSEPEQVATIQQQQQIQAEQLRDLQQPTSTQQPLDQGAITEEEQLAEPTLDTLEAADASASAAIYLTAFSDLACGRMAEAEIGFSAFLRENPAHPYAANARYWLASAQIALNKTNAAITNLQQIINDQNAAHKAPAALTQLARIYHQQGDEPQARQLIKQLRSRYPDSREARHSLAEETDMPH
jgi:tol-pal system protein YbgF